MANVSRLTILVLALGVVLSCGGSKNCDACGEGTLCDTNTGKCIAKGGTGGGGPACSPVCSGTRAICDNQTNPQNPRCVQCLTNAQCSNGATCSNTTQTCIGGSGAGGGGGGSSSAGGGSASTGGGIESTGGGGEESAGGGAGTAGGGATGGGSGTGGGGSVAACPGGAPTWSVVGDAGTYTGAGSCAPQDGGVVACNPGCSEGFHCQGGMCVLNGGSGPVQVTLRWNTLEDLDLHVSEPLPNGGHCEIAYDNDNRPVGTSSCGARGSLDLDSEAGCSADGVSIENVIYPPGVAPCGTYTVWVNHYLNCDMSLTMVPFELEARFAGMSIGVCGMFTPSDPDWNDGNQTMTRYMMTFTVP